MGFIYKRLGSQGEIHLSEDGKMTLCSLLCTNYNWFEVEEKPDKYPQMCVDCLAVKKKMNENVKAKAKAT